MTLQLQNDKKIPKLENRKKRNSKYFDSNKHVNYHHGIDLCNQFKSFSQDTKPI